MKLTRLGLGIAALFAVCLAIAPVAYAAQGMFSNLPVVGGAAYCDLFAGDGTTCAGSVPAGPTVVTGNERYPADTVLPNGSSPQTVRVPGAAIGVGPYQYNAPLTAASITVLPTSRRLMLEPAGTIAALTVVFPAATLLVDNQTFGICTTQIVTTLTVTAGSGSTVLNAPTALLVPVATGGASCPEWTYRLSNTSWYRIH